MGCSASAADDDANQYRWLCERYNQEPQRDRNKQFIHHRWMENRRHQEEHNKPHPALRDELYPDNFEQYWAQEWQCELVEKMMKLSKELGALAIEYEQLEKIRNPPKDYRIK